MVSWQTPNRLATLAGASPARRRDTAAYTTSALVTLPGRASHGSTRSLRLQRKHRATPIGRTLNASSVASLRHTRTLVRRGDGAPHLEQRHELRSWLTSSGLARREA